MATPTVRAQFVSDDELAHALGDPQIAVGGPEGSHSLAISKQHLSDAVAKLGPTGVTRAITRFQLTEMSRGAGSPSCANKIDVDCPPPAPWYSTVRTSTDWSGFLIRTREGDYSNFGYRKIQVAHNLYNLNAITAGYNGFADQKSGDNWTYYAYDVINGYPRIQINSVASRSYTSQYGRAPDGDMIGTITSYCVGFTYCPDCVN